MGENICKQNNPQGINLQTIQIAHSAQKKNFEKWSDLIDISLKKTYRWPKNILKNAQPC